MDLDSGEALLRWDDAGQVRLQELLLSSGTIVDALLGTGATGDPRPPLDAVIGELNRSGISIVAVDLPSGLDCDTGKASAQTIRATHTCTFVAMKGLASCSERST